MKDHSKTKILFPPFVTLRDETRETQINLHGGASMSKDILYFLLLIAPVIPAFVVLIHDTDLPKEKRDGGTRHHSKE